MWCLGHLGMFSLAPPLSQGVRGMQKREEKNEANFLDS